LNLRPQPPRGRGCSGREPDARQGYYCAKVAQEKLIEVSGIPYTIIRSTQFLEFLGGIADAGTDGSIVRLPMGLLQPIAANDVANVIAEVAFANARDGILAIAGQECERFNAVVAHYSKVVAAHVIRGGMAVGDPVRAAWPKLRVPDARTRFEDPW
jgi:hypothetical protein